MERDDRKPARPSAKSSLGKVEQLTMATIDSGRKKRDESMMTSLELHSDAMVTTHFWRELDSA